MSTRKPHPAASIIPPAADPVSLADLPRQQLAVGTHAACAVFRGFESIRRIQQKTAHQALAHHQAMAAKLAEPCQPMDLLAIQAELLRQDLQGAAAYWQQLAAATLEMQRDLLGGIARSEADEGEAGTHGLASAPAFNPFFFTVNGAQHATTP